MMDLVEAGLMGIPAAALAPLVWGGLLLAVMKVAMRARDRTLPAAREPRAPARETFRPAA